MSLPPTTATDSGSPSERSATLASRVGLPRSRAHTIGSSQSAGTPRRFRFHAKRNVALFVQSAPSSIHLRLLPNDTFRQTGVTVGIAALGTLVPADVALGGDLQSYVDGLHHALIAGAVVAAAGAIATAWLLLHVRGPAEDEARMESV